MKNTKIEWCDHTFNGWIGCSKISPGCQHCYAATMMDTRYGRVKWGKNGTRKRTSEALWRTPLRWNREATAKGIRPRVFCSSLADVFEDRKELIPWREDLWSLIAKTNHLDWLLLTKRPENIAGMLPAGGCPSNVWLGTSVESAAYVHRIDVLRNVPAPIRFLSMEPLIGPVGKMNLKGIDWVICGEESGGGWRPIDPDWIREICDQCLRPNIPFFFKQWGGFSPKKLGRLLDGREWNEYPRRE